MSRDSAAVGERDEYDYPDRFDRNPLAQTVVLRWKHAVTTVLIAATAWALYNVAGGWSLDATVFALAAVAFAIYSLVTLRADLE